MSEQILKSKCRMSDYIKILCPSARVINYDIPPCDIVILHDRRQADIHAGCLKHTLNTLSVIIAV